MSHVDRFPARLTSRPVSRRALLGLLTVAAGGVLSACVSSQPTAAPKATEPPKPAAPTTQPAAPAAQPAPTAAQPAAAKPTEAAKPAAQPTAQAPAGPPWTRRRPV